MQGVERAAIASLGWNDAESVESCPIWHAGEFDPTLRSLDGFRFGQLLPDLPARGKVAHLGCGAGMYLRALARLRPDLEWVGMDPNRHALSLARELTSTGPRSSERISFRRIEGPTLPTGTGEFALVLVLDHLEHVADPPTFVEEARRSLIGGGRLHVCVTLGSDPVSVARWIRSPGSVASPAPPSGPVRQSFHRDDLYRLAIQAGFRISRIRFSGHLAGQATGLVRGLGTGLRRLRGNLEPFGPGPSGDRGAPSILSRLAFWLDRIVDEISFGEARILCRIPGPILHLSLAR